MSSARRNPYVGLRPFQAHENLIFFGRDNQTLELLQRLYKHRFVAVVGSSGCGKSSLIRAGLIPALKGGFLLEGSSNWIISVMKPGRNPMFNLAKNLLLQADPEADTEAVEAFVRQIKKRGVAAFVDRLSVLRNEKKANFFLLVDQFEELFRFAMGSRESAKRTNAIDFVNIVLKLSEQQNLPFYVVLTMRSDFIGDCSQFYKLPEAMNKSQYLVPRLSRLELKKVIEGPAKLYGKGFQTALTSRLLNDLGKVDDELPLVQHALMRMWEYEMDTDKSGEIDLEDYRQIGGVEQALGRDADKVLQELNGKQQKIAETLFKALTEIDENGRKIRRPVNLSDLVDLTGAKGEQIEEVIDHFVKDRRSFLIVDQVGGSEDKVIDISHESLIRQWDTLLNWVDEEGKTADTYKRLAEAYRVNQLGERDLLIGSELDIALEWKNKYDPKAVWANRYREGFDDVMGYLQASDRANKKRKRKRALKNRALIVFLISVIVAGSLISWQNTRKNNASATHFEAQGQLPVDPTGALQLELEANQIYQKAAYAQEAQRIFNTNSVHEYSQQQQTEVAVAYAPDKNTLLTEKFKDSLYQIRSGENLTPGQEFELSYLSFARFSNDGASVFICCDQDMLSFSVDRNTGQKVSFPQIENDRMVIYARRYDRVIIGFSDSVFIFNNSGNMVKKIDLPEWFTLSALVMDPSGTRFLASSKIAHFLFDMDGQELVDIERGDHKKFDDIGAYSAAAFSHNGTKLLTATGKKATLWNMENGERIVEMIGHTDEVHYVSFSPDKRNIVTASLDNNVVLWDTLGSQVQRLVANNGPVFSVDFMEDGKYVRTYARSGVANLWRLKEYRIVAPVVIEPDSLTSRVQFLPATDKFLVGSRDGRIALNDLKGAKVQAFTGLNASIASLASSPAGNRIAAVDEFGNTAMWGTDGTRDERFNWKVGAAVRAMDISPGGDALLIGTLDGAIYLGRAGDKAPKQIAAHGAFINSIRFSPDGDTFLSASSDHKALLYSLDGELLREFSHPDKMITSVAFSPNGKEVLTGSEDKTAILWSIDGTRIRDLKGHAQTVNSVAFSPDGQHLSTGAFNGVARIWQRDKKEPVQTITRRNYNPNDEVALDLKDVIRSVHFTSDGSRMVTTSLVHSSMLWEIRLQQTLEEYLENNADPVTWEPK